MKLHQRTCMHPSLLSRPVRTGPHLKDWSCATFVDNSPSLLIAADSGGTIVLVGQDGVQRPPIHFPRGGHLLAFLSCLENGLLPHGQLDPPLWSQRGKGQCTTGHYALHSTILLSASVLHWSRASWLMTRSVCLLFLARVFSCARSTPFTTAWPIGWSAPFFLC